MTDYPHLTAWAAKIAILPADDRISHIRTDRWIGYPVAARAVSRLEEILNWPSKQRMPNLLIHWSN